MTYFVQPRAQCFVPSATPRPFKVWQAPRSKIGCLTSASGQKRTFEHVRAMSALPPIADIGTQSRDVRFVPKADKVRCSKKALFDHLVGELLKLSRHH